MHIFQKLPVSDSARISLDNYLRANHFTEQTYFSDPRVIQGYQDELTAEAVGRYVAAGLQTGDVRVFLPASLGW